MSAHEYTANRLEKGFVKCDIPDYMQDGIREYVLRGRELGGFLSAIFENNLVESCGRADPTNIQCLEAYAGLLYNYVPRNCWGSPDTVRKWHGTQALEAEQEASS